MTKDGDTNTIILAVDKETAYRNLCSTERSGSLYTDRENFCGSETQIIAYFDDPSIYQEIRKKQKEKALLTNVKETDIICYSYR